MHYNWHRYYDPDTGRYLTPDPIGLAGGINPFVYALNNPANKIDPLGLWSFWYGGSAVAALPHDGANVGTGFAWDSETGDGLYLTAGQTEGLAGSAGGEVGGYTGSISGETTIVTAGALNLSVGLVFGKGSNIFGFNIGIVFGYSPGLPIEATVSHNKTWFTGESPSLCP